MAHSRRFELRMMPKELEAWRALAEAQGVAVAEMVRQAMEYAAANMPTGYVKRVKAEQFEALCSAFSVRTNQPADGDVMDLVRTECATVHIGPELVRTDEDAP